MRRGCWLQCDNTSLPMDTIRVGKLGNYTRVGCWPYLPSQNARGHSSLWVHKAGNAAQDRRLFKTRLLMLVLLGDLYLRDRTSLRVSRRLCFYTPLLFSVSAVGLLSGGMMEGTPVKMPIARVSHNPSEQHIRARTGYPCKFKVQAFQVMQRTIPQ